MTVWASVLALAGALLVWSPTASEARHRVREIVGDASPSHGRALVDRLAGRRGPAGAGAVRRRLLAAAAGLAAGGLLGGGLLGFGAAAAVAVLADRLLGRASPDADAGRERALERELPVACDLLAVCLAGGVPVGGALAAVAAAAAGPLAGELRTVAALYRLGAPPAKAWAQVPPSLAALGRILVRAGESGSSVVPALQALAADARAAARARTDQAVRRVGVWLLGPLGACFLPAFLCLGVVPLVLGIAGQVFR